MHCFQNGISTMHYLSDKRIKTEINRKIAYKKIGIQHSALTVQPQQVLTNQFNFIKYIKNSFNIFDFRQIILTRVWDK